MEKKKVIIVTLSSLCGVTLLIAVLTVIIALSSGASEDNELSAGITVSSDTSEDETTTEETTTEPVTEELTTDETTTEETTTEVITTEEPTTEEVTAEPTTKETTTPEPTTEEETTENPTLSIDADISAFIDESGTTVSTRFLTPEGFKRLTYAEDTFSYMLQNLPLKPHDSKIYLYSGKEKENQTWHAAVIDMKLLSNGWLQCADCVMKLIGDYLYNNGRYSDISFNTLSGLKIPFAEWAKGFRLKTSGSKAWLEKTASESTDESTYKKYMNTIYQYANTTSLKNQDESKSLDIKNIFPGAYFIMGAKPSLGLKLGHAIIVVDVAKNTETGEIAFLLAQGSTPSEEMNVFLNPLHPDDPWFYSSEIDESFFIPFREFDADSLYYYNPISIPAVITE